MPLNFDQDSSCFSLGQRPKQPPFCTADRPVLFVIDFVQLKLDFVKSTVASIDMIDPHGVPMRSIIRLKPLSDISQAMQDSNQQVDFAEEVSYGIVGFLHFGDELEAVTDNDIGNRDQPSDAGRYGKWIHCNLEGRASSSTSEAQRFVERKVG